MRLMAIAVVILAVAACDTFDASKDIDFDSPALRTQVAKHEVLIPRVELTAVSEFNARQAAAVTPEATNVAAWKRPGANATAVASCPEGTATFDFLKPDPYRDNWSEFVSRYPHGLINCVQYSARDQTPGITFIVVTPIPTGVYFSDMVPTQTPTHVPIRR